MEWIFFLCAAPLPKVCIQMMSVCMLSMFVAFQVPMNLQNHFIHFHFSALSSCTKCRGDFHPVNVHIWFTHFECFCVRNTKFLTICWVEGVFDLGIKLMKKWIQNPFGSTIIGTRIAYNCMVCKWKHTISHRMERMKLWKYLALNCLYCFIKHNLLWTIMPDWTTIAMKTKLDCFPSMARYVLNLNAKGNSYHASSTQSMKPSPPTVICGLLFPD